VPEREIHIRPSEYARGQWDIVIRANNQQALVVTVTAAELTAIQALAAAVTGCRVIYGE
jgi:hypothetical protein